METSQSAQGAKHSLSKWVTVTVTAPTEFEGGGTKEGQRLLISDETHRWSVSTWHSRQTWFSIGTLEPEEKNKTSESTVEQHKMVQQPFKAGWAQKQANAKIWWGTNSECFLHSFCIRGVLFITMSLGTCIIHL